MSICFVGTCLPLNIANGWIFYNQLLVSGEYYWNTTAVFLCNDGYKLEGQATSRCNIEHTNRRGHWRGPSSNPYALPNTECKKGNDN